MLERVDVEDFLSALGIKVESRSGDNMLFLCPWHTDRHPSARMNVNTTAWLCSAGCGKGNAITFLAMLRGMSTQDARDHVYARYGIGPGAAIDDLESEVRRNLGIDSEPLPPRVAPDEAWVEYLAVDWEVDRSHSAAQYMFGRGFTPEVLSRWQIGYDETSQRVTIPVRDHRGKLVGFKGRAIDSERHPRYLVLGDNRPDHIRYGFHTYSKSHYVFGLDRWRGEKHAYIVEGELNVIAMQEYHGRSTVGIAGSEFSEHQRELIAARFSHVTVLLDDDELKLLQPGNENKINSGRKGAAKVASALMPFVHVDVILHAHQDAVDLIGDSQSMQALLDSAAPALELGVRRELDLVLST